MTYEEAARDKRLLISALYKERDPATTLQLIGGMGVGSAILAEAVGDTLDRVNALLDGGIVDPPTDEDQIDRLRTTTLFLLERGILNPEQLGLWLTEQNDDTGGMPPILHLKDNEGVMIVISASRTFTRPDVPHQIQEHSTGQ